MNKEAAENAEAKNSAPLPLCSLPCLLVPNLFLMALQVTNTLSGSLLDLAHSRLLRGKPLADSMRVIMRKWVYDAIAAIPRGDRAAMLAYFQRIVYQSKVAPALARIDPFSTSRRAAESAARIDKWRGTLAAWIVFKLNPYGARSKDPGSAFQRVNRWVSNKLFATNLHKAGLFKARSQLHAPPGSDPLPKLRNAPGDYTESVADGIVDLLAENWASAGGPRAAGIAALAPGAFADTSDKLAEECFQSMLHSLLQAAKEAGFSAAA